MAGKVGQHPVEIEVVEWITECDTDIVPDDMNLQKSTPTIWFKKRLTVVEKCILFSWTCYFEPPFSSVCEDRSQLYSYREYLQRRGAVKTAPNSLFPLGRKVCFNVCCTTVLITINSIAIYDTMSD